MSRPDQIKKWGLTWDPPESNGCGPWWVPVEWKDTYYKSQCDVHDRDYNDGVDQDEADRNFYEAMLIRVDNEPDRWTRWGRRLQAFTFFWIVRHMGFTSHKKGLDL